MLSELFESCFHINLAQSQDSANSQILKLAPLPNCKGVLLFTDKDDTPIQLLIAANIRRTATARLIPEDTETAGKRAGLRSIVKHIYYTRCFNDMRNALLHYNTAKALYPNKYNSILKLPRQTFVKIDLSTHWPAFLTSENPTASSHTKTFGPFPTRRSANELIKILQNAFDLCQMPNLIAHPKKARSCPYLQMNTCPAPCVGNISRDQYIEKIIAATDTAAGNVDSQIETLQHQMQQASALMDFETAQHIKKQIEQLKLLHKYTYKWTTDLSQLCILHMDRSAKLSVKKRKKQQLFTAFIIRPSSITELGDFAMDALDDLHSIMTKLMTTTPPAENARDLLALTCYHLYRSNPQGIWINCSDKTIPTADQIAEKLCKRFKINNKVQ